MTVPPRSATPAIHLMLVAIAVRHQAFNSTSGIAAPVVIGSSHVQSTVVTTPRNCQPAWTLLLSGFALQQVPAARRVPFVGVDCFHDPRDITTATSVGLCASSLVALRARTLLPGVKFKANEPACGPHTQVHLCAGTLPPESSPGRGRRGCASAKVPPGTSPKIFQPCRLVASPQLTASSRECVGVP
jgi:hypothetical protein